MLTTDRRRQDLHLARVGERLHDLNTDAAPATPTRTPARPRYGNGITGTSGSYDAGTEAARPQAAATTRTPSSSPTPTTSATWPATDSGALRFSYATDPGLARPGWFIDDVKVTVDRRRPATQVAARHRLRDRAAAPTTRGSSTAAAGGPHTGAAVHQGLELRRRRRRGARRPRLLPGDAGPLRLRPRRQRPDRPRPDRLPAGPVPGLHRRGARLRQRRHRRPAGPVAAGLAAGAGRRHARTSTTPPWTAAAGATYSATPATATPTTTPTRSTRVDGNWAVPLRLPELQRHRR